MGNPISDHIIGYIVIYIYVYITIYNYIYIHIYIHVQLLYFVYGGSKKYNLPVFVTRYKIENPSVIPSYNLT